MDDLFKALSGKKTYLIAAFIALSVFAHVIGWIDKETLDNAYVLLTGAGLAALRAGITK